MGVMLFDGVESSPQGSRFQISCSVLGSGLQGSSSHLELKWVASLSLVQVFRVAALISSRVEVVVVEHQDLLSWISWLILRIE